MAMPTPLIVMIWHRRAHPNPAQAWFRDLVAGVLAPRDPDANPLP